MVEYMSRAPGLVINTDAMSLADITAASGWSKILHARVAISLMSALDAGYEHLSTELGMAVTGHNLTADPEWELVGAIVKDRVHYLVFDVDVSVADIVQPGGRSQRDRETLMMAPPLVVR